MTDSLGHGPWDCHRDTVSRAAAANDNLGYEIARPSSESAIPFFFFFKISRAVELFGCGNILEEMSREMLP